MPAQCRLIEWAAAHVDLEHFGEAFAFMRGAIELNAKAVLFRAGDTALKAAKAIDVNHDERAGRRNDLAQHVRST